MNQNNNNAGDIADVIFYVTYNSRVAIFNIIFGFSGESRHGRVK